LFWNGTAWQWALVDAAGHVQVDTLSTVMDVLAATAANQATMITALELIDDLRNALDSVGTDELDVNVEASVLPTGAATAAHQVTQNTALQLIDNLVTALQSVATDRLIVRGEDQLESYHSVLAVTNTTVISGASGFCISIAIPAGRIAVVTAVVALNTVSPVTRMIMYQNHDGANSRFHEEIKAFAILDQCSWSGMLWLDEADYILVEFIGGLVGDNCQVAILGKYFTLEV